jgi:hypothetical protein
VDHCLSLWTFFLTIILSVLLFTASWSDFGIFKLFIISLIGNTAMDVLHHISIVYDSQSYWQGCIEYTSPWTPVTYSDVINSTTHTLFSSIDHIWYSKIKVTFKSNYVLYKKRSDFQPAQNSCRLFKLWYFSVSLGLIALVEESKMPG